MLQKHMDSSSVLPLTSSGEKHCCFLYPGDLHTISGGYRYDREIIGGLRRLGWQISLISLNGSYPKPNKGAIQEAQTILANLTGQQLIVADGLALGALPEQARLLAKRHWLIALIHHPLYLESGLSDEEAKRLRTSERQALRHATHVIVTSSATLKSLHRKC